MAICNGGGNIALITSLRAFDYTMAFVSFSLGRFVSAFCTANPAQYRIVVQLQLLVSQYMAKLRIINLL